MELQKEELINIVSQIVSKTLTNANIIPAAIINNLSVNNNLQTISTADTNNSDNAGSLKLLNKKLIVEEDVKSAIKKNINIIEINKSAIITPLAKDMINHKKIKLLLK